MSGPYYVVRYGAMRNLGKFTAHEGDSYHRGDWVVVNSERGQEIGEVLCVATERTDEFLESSGGGAMVRHAGAADLAEWERLRAVEKEELRICKEMIARHRLQMDLVDTEHIFGGERIVFYYLAEKRVDFRNLVKDLARQFQTRIEMRQIGVRDEAKLLADYGDCGKPVCCNTHLTAMPPVSMKMAKIQKSTLDPSKISGRCGRLKCCLRYEFSVYEELDEQLPDVGARIVTKRGSARVLAHETLAQKVLVEFEDHRRILVDKREILGVATA